MSDYQVPPNSQDQSWSSWLGIPKIKEAWLAAHPQEPDPNAPKVNRDLPQAPARDFEKGFGY